MEHSPAFLLIEDLDAVFHGRENVSFSGAMTQEAPLTFDVLLNAISGVESADGMFLVVTTNDMSKLDPALGIPVEGAKDNISTRPGRLDRVLFLGGMGAEERRKLAANILRDCPEHIETLVNDGANDMPAQFQERCGQFALKEFWITEHEKTKRPAKSDFAGGLPKNQQSS